jgi:hypothetical protein
MRRIDSLQLFRLFMYAVISIRIFAIPFEGAGVFHGPFKPISAATLIVFLGIQAIYWRLTDLMSSGRASWWQQFLLPLFFVWGAVGTARSFREDYLRAPYWELAELLAFILFGAALVCYFFAKWPNWYAEYSARKSRGVLK